MQQFLDFLGIEKERLSLHWVSASEGKKFAEVVSAFTGKVAELGPRKNGAGG